MGSLEDEHTHFSMTSHKNDKRTDTPDNRLENTLVPQNSDDWPRFLVIQDAVQDSNSLLKLSPFAIAKGITGLAAKPVSVKKTSFGLLVEVSQKSHADNLLRSKEMVYIPIKVTPHRTLNSSKGVIRCRELSGMTEEEIADELSEQSVSAVKRIMIKRQKATDTYILTFQKAELPQMIKVGYMNIRVNPYIPNPLRCYRCQDYGHGANKCTRPERCSRCGQNHANQNCNEEPSCVHCQQNHETSDRTCHRYLMEKKIQTVKFTERISFPEARKKVEAMTVRPSYSEAVAKTTKSVAIQTDVTWPKESSALSALQTTPDFSQGLIEGLKAGIVSNPALGQFVQALFEIMKLELPNMLSKGQDEASTSTTGNKNTSYKSNDEDDASTSTTNETTENQRNPNTGAKSPSPVLKSLNKSTGDIPGATTSEVGPTPPGVKPKTSGIKFPLAPKQNNSKDRSIKTAPRTKVSGPK